MTDTREALRLALDCIELLLDEPVGEGIQVRQRITAEMLRGAEHAISALQEALAAPQEPLPMSDEFARTVRARPLAYSLDDYWHSVAGDGPLGFTWKDKPHRIVYDLLGAVRYYAAPAAARPQDEWLKEAGRLIDECIITAGNDKERAALLAHLAARPAGAPLSTAGVAPTRVGEHNGGDYDMRHKTPAGVKGPEHG